MEQRLSELIGPAFWDSHKAVREGSVTELVEQGGRGSGKSSYLSIELVLFLLKHPDANAVAVRKIANTLRGSVYAQILWAIGVLGLRKHFRCTLSPLQCEYLPTGQRILFFGLDDPGKLKSIKVPNGYIGVCWFEELDQFSPEEVRSVEQSVFRGGPVSLSLKSFNPPPMPGHWVNSMVLQPKSGRRVHRSNYLQMPRHWLGERFFLDAEYLQKCNPQMYAHEYLGECVGLGDNVFQNIRLEEIADSKIACFDRVVSGVDWGWWPDPWAFNRVYFDASRRVLYVFDELTRWRTGNQETAKEVLRRIYDAESVIADSAEEKSIADYRQMGIACRAVRKGPGSVEYSMKWLQSLLAIIIDPLRCPDTAKEFLNYLYSRGRDGEIIPGYPDKNNHHIDAVRYAVSPMWGRRE